MSGVVSSGLGPLQALAAAAPDAAVLSDFDGTLAAIVPDPADARPLAGAASVLKALTARFAVVAVVSGRPARFLLEHLGHAGPGLGLFGLYGLEWVEDGEVRLDPRAAPWVEAAGRVAAAAERSGPAGLGVERKGPSVALHWRRAADPDSVAGWAHGFAADRGAREGFSVQPGRLALELRPPLPLDKGVVVERLVEGRAAGCFFGDDAGDLPAFAALDRLADRGCATVRVAVADVESPPELVRAADVVVGGPDEALALMEDLAAGPP